VTLFLFSFLDRGKWEWEWGFGVRLDILKVGRRKAEYIVLY